MSLEMRHFLRDKRFVAFPQHQPLGGDARGILGLLPRALGGAI